MGSAEGTEREAAPAAGGRTRRLWALWPRAAWVMAVMTGPIGLAGLYDLATARGLGARLIGGVLAASAVFVLWAVAGRRRDLADPVWAYLAALVVVMVALFLGVRLWDGFAFQVHLIVVAAYVVVLGGVAAAVAIAGRPAHRGPVARRNGDAGGGGGLGQLLIGPGATVVAALVALPLTWYSAQYEPSVAQSVVSIQAELADAKRQDDPAGGKRMTVTAKIKVVNTGRTSVRMIFSQYEIVGSRVTLAEARGDQVDERVGLGEDGRDAAGRYAGFADYGAARLIQYGRVFWDQTTLEPNEESTLKVLAFYPQKTFSVVRLGVDLVYARADRVPVGAGEYADSAYRDSPEWRRMGGSCGARRYGRVQLARWKIEPASLLERLTTSDREVITARFVPESTGERIPADAGRLVPQDYTWGQWWSQRPDFDFQLQKRGDPCRNIEPGHNSIGTDRGLERRSKLGESGAMAELASPMR